LIALLQFLEARPADNGHMKFSSPLAWRATRSGVFFDFRVSLANSFFRIQEVQVIKDLLKDADTRMHGAIHALQEDLSAIRTGRANPSLVEKLQVEYYGAPTPLMQLASISVPEARSLMIKPFDPTTLKAIEKAILTSDLGLTPNNDGKLIRLNLPPLNEERRRDLTKHVHARLEDARVALRNIRRDVLKDMKDFENEKLISEDDLQRGEADVQKLMDHFTAEVDKLGHSKEHEIMEV
jgi:ribosome recycling factor